MGYVKEHKMFVMGAIKKKSRRDFGALKYMPLTLTNVAEYIL